MQDILSESAGYNVNLADEVEYFDPIASIGWYLATTPEGRPVALIRHFKQNSEWSLGELYVKPGIQNRALIASSLLERFQKSVQFPSPHRLRFDIHSHDVDLNSTLKNAGFSERIQIFRYFEWHKGKTDDAHETHSLSVSDAQEVAEVLSHLNPVSEDEAQKWIENQAIMAIRERGRIVAAAQMYESDDTLEVNRFATHAKYLRQGFARKLMKAIFSESKKRNKKCVYLKVEDIRLPAISFYRSVGFIENQNKCQTWHSRWY